MGWVIMFFKNQIFTLLIVKRVFPGEIPTSLARLGREGK
ncbi:Uncharacterized protein ChrSV_4891 [Chromobacterium vaccinii]|nr:Uncharacterized protein ChrSW_4885 [Chromobacterium vaccinii]QND92346.1 Uncharacterized protein ChrSV_4891 [Chromobacterium vaccinii]